MKYCCLQGSTGALIGLLSLLSNCQDIVIVVLSRYGCIVGILLWPHCRILLLLYCRYMLYCRTIVAASSGYCYCHMSRCCYCLGYCYCYIVGHWCWDMVILVLSTCCFRHIVGILLLHCNNIVARYCRGI